MSQYVLPVCFTVFIWWFSTGVVLYLNSQDERHRRNTFLVGSVITLACLFGLTVSSEYATKAYAMIAFTQALIVWGWCEMGYFMGFITGPRKTKCPTPCTGFQRFKYAIETSLHHELMVILIGSLLLVYTWNQPNQIGMWTFVILWLMRWSAKLNLFLGVRNMNYEWIPEHLKYISSYIKSRPMNFLFPFSVTVASIIATVLVMSAFNDQSSNFHQFGHMILATLLILAVIEHWFLILPINDSALWDWASRMSNTVDRDNKSTAIGRSVHQD